MPKVWIPPSSSVARSRNARLGSEALIYFERVGDGRLIIPPVCWAQVPVCKLPKPHERTRDCVCGYIRREARTVQELEKISKRFEEQKKREFAMIDEPHRRRIAAKMAEVRSRLNTRLLQTDSQFEKDFIRIALKRLEAGEKGWEPRRIEGHLHIESTEAPLAKS